MKVPVKQSFLPQKKSWSQAESSTSGLILAHTHTHTHTHTQLDGALSTRAARFFAFPKRPYSLCGDRAALTFGGPCISYSLFASVCGKSRDVFRVTPTTAGRRLPQVRKLRVLPFIASAAVTLVPGRPACNAGTGVRSGSGCGGGNVRKATLKQTGETCRG
jgi:hypothetical protein